MTWKPHNFDDGPEKKIENNMSEFCGYTVVYPAFTGDRNTL